MPGGVVGEQDSAGDAAAGRVGDGFDDGMVFEFFGCDVQAAGCGRDAAQELGTGVGGPDQVGARSACWGTSDIGGGVVGVEGGLDGVDVSGVGICRVSNSVTSADALNCGYASCLTSCHRGRVSEFWHFFNRHFGP